MGQVLGAELATTNPRWLRPARRGWDLPGSRVLKARSFFALSCLARLGLFRCGCLPYIAEAALGTRVMSEEVDHALSIVIIVLTVVVATRPFRGNSTFTIFTMDSYWSKGELWFVLVWREGHLGVWANSNFTNEKQEIFYILRSGNFRKWE